MTPSAYWQLFLKQQPEDILWKKLSHTQRVKADDTTIVVSVNGCSQRDYTKRFDKTDIDWTAVEKQLLLWGNLFRLGKELRLKISINYIEDSNPTSSRKRDKRGSTSVTQRTLADQEAQIDAEHHISGQPSAWRDDYRMMRCPGPPCHLGQYCWQDPVGEKHFKLRMHHLKNLVKYVEQGGVLETHDDIPDTVREQLYAKEQQGLERQQKKTNHSTAGSMCHPININVLPTQSPQPSMHP